MKHLLEQLSRLRGSKTVILGVGNILKGDDGAGPKVCELLKGIACVEVIDGGTAPENYIGPIVAKAPEVLLIVDAMDFGASPGTTKIFNPAQLGKSALSTHYLSPRVLVDMINAQIDVQVLLIGVQPAQVHLGKPLSPKVAQAVSFLADTIASIFDNRVESRCGAVV
jgi:hydrogenase 3 maturation protease